MREFEFDFTDAIRTGLLATDRLLYASEPGLVRCMNLHLVQEGKLNVLKALPDFLPGYALGGTSPFSNVSIVDPEAGVVLTKAIKILDFTNFFVFICTHKITGAYVNYLFTVYEDVYTQLSNPWPSFTDGIAYDNVQAVMLLEDEIWWSRIMDYDFTIDGKGAGKMLWPFSGRPKALGQLGDKVVVIGEGGLLIMRPLDSDPYWATTRLPILINTALPYGFCHGWCFFFDFIGNLWIFDGEELSRQGYKQHFRNFTSLNKVQYSASLLGFFISDFSECYLLTKNALTECSNLPLCFVEHADALYGEFIDLVGSDDILIQTTPSDMGFRSRKNVSGIQCGVDSHYPLYVSVGWRNDIKSVIRWSTEVEVGPDGYIALSCSGVELCLRLRTTRHAELRISNLSVFFKYEDKRFLRSRYDNKINT